METLSVIIPVYNCKDYLKSCVDSLLQVNSHSDVPPVCEIILVDDGSTDGSSGLCDQLAAAASSPSCQIRVIHQPNSGVSAARNRGLRVASGSYLLFVDSDDTVDAKKLADLIKEVSTAPIVDMAVFGISFDYYSGNRLYRQDFALPPVEGRQNADAYKRSLGTLFKHNMLSSLCNKLIRRRVITDSSISLREEMFLYEDLEFSLRVMAQCDSFLFCREAIYHYRQSPGEGNAGRRLKRVPHISELVDKIEEALIPLGAGTEIPLTLYLVLAREKTRCSTKSEIDDLCRDFREWVDRRQLNQAIATKKQAMRFYRGQSVRLILQREKTNIRHKLANWIKQNIGDYRKWKSRS